MGSSGLEGEFQYDSHGGALSTDAASSGHSTPAYMSDASPNYMKPTNSSASNANAGNSQKSVGPLTRRSSVKLAKGITRMSSSKWRRPSMRKNSAGIEQRVKLKKWRSIKFATLESSRSFRRTTSQYHDPQSLSDEMDASPNYLKATRSSDVRKAGSQPSPGNSASSFSGKDGSERVLSNPKVKSSSSSYKALVRSPTLRPVRILTKMASLKAKRASRIHPEIPMETSVHRATCSSIIKDSKFNDQVETQPGDDVSKKISSMKVCPYSYCSLHGHHHSTPPTLRRIKSAKKRTKSQGSKTPDGQSPRNGKKSSSLVRKIGEDEGISDGDSGGKEIPHASRKSILTVPEKPVDTNTSQKADTNANASEHTTNDASLASLESSSDEQHNLVTFMAQEEVHTETSCISESENFGKIEKESIPIKCDSGGKFNRNENCAGVAALDLVEPADSNLDLENSLKRDGVTSTYHQQNSGDVEIVGVENQGSLADTSQNPQKQFCISEGPTSASKEAEEIPKSLSGGTEPNSPADDVPFGGRKYNGLWYLIYQHMVSDVAANGEALSPSARSIEEEQVDDEKRIAEVDDKDSSEKILERESDSKEADDAANQETELRQSDAIKLLQEAINKILLSKSPSHSSYSKSTAPDMAPKEKLSQKNVNEGVMESQISTTVEEKSMETNADENQSKTDNVPLVKDDTAAQPVNKWTQQKSNRWSNVKKIILQRRFIKTLEKMRNFNPRIPRQTSSEFASEGERVNLRRQSIEERKNSEEWMLDYALRQVVSKLDPEQKRKVTLLVEAFERVAPGSGGEPRVSPKVKYSPKVNDMQTGDIYSKDHKDREIGSRNLSDIFLEELPGDLSAQRNKPITEEQQSPLSYGVLKESSSDCCIIDDSSQLAFEDVKGDQKVKEFKASNPNEDMADTMNPSDQQNSALCSMSPKAQVLTDLKHSMSVDSPESRTDVEVSADGKSQEVHIKNIDLLQDYPKAVLGGNNMETYSLTEEMAKGFDKLKSGSPKSPSPDAYVEAKSELENTGQVESTKLEEGNENKDFGSDTQKQENEASQEPSPADESVTTADAGEEPRLENKRYTKLWFLIYKHMVSGLTAEDGGKSLSKEEEDCEKRKHNQGNEPASGIDDMYMDQNTDDDSVKLRRIEAIKLVQEAIDQISLPEAEDGSPKDQFSASKNCEQHPEEMAHVKCGESVNPAQTNEDSSIGKANERDRESKPEAKLESRDISGAEDDGAKLKETDKSKDRPIKNWNNLKKVILLKRFVKALEKVRKINPREPRLLPLEPNQESEKVNLKHQDMDERKNAEEWMLDYALRKVVSRLTPERKRKVQLLVEAFETVIPTVGN